MLEPWIIIPYQGYGETAAFVEFGHVKKYSVSLAYSVTEIIRRLLGGKHKRWKPYWYFVEAAI